MATNDLLEAEARERPRVAVLAALAAVLTLISPLIVRIAVGGEAPDNRLTAAILQADHRTAVLLSAAASVLGLLLITAVLDFLLRSTRARFPQLPPFIRPLLLVGGLGLAVFSGVLQVVSTIRIEHFATEGTQTWEELEAIRSYGALAIVGIVAQFSFAFGFIMVALNAMRVGLLSRFMGYLGVFSAVMFVLPIIPLPVVQTFWLLGLAFLFWGANKARVPPAWALGEAVPWPTAAEVREQRVRAAESRRGGGAPAPEPAEVETVEDADAASTASAGAARRKRKKRR